MNRLDRLPRGFGAFPVLEVLDLTYNNLTADSFPGNFFMMGEHMNYMLFCWIIRINNINYYNTG